MKLLYITNGITGAGGLERVLSIKAGYLAEHYGYEVHILSLNESDKGAFFKFNDNIVFHAIKVDGNPLSYIYRYIKGIGQIVADIKPEIISVCDDGLKGFFLPLLLRKPCPVIYERHVSKLIAINEENNSGYKRMLANLKFKLMDKLANTFDAFVVLTDGNKKEWKVSNLHVIANPASFYPASSSALTNKEVIAVGKQGYQKGYDRLIKAWKKVNETYPEWRLSIYGKKEPDQRLGELALQQGVSSSISFYPPEKDIKSKYLESSICVMSSRFEGFGMVLIEAMSCGVPCISFDCPYGPSDIIRNGVDGLLVPDGDISGLANAIINLMENESRRKEMGMKAKENVSRYSPEIVVRAWDELFKSLII